jgi:hypothetical protein
MLRLRFPPVDSDRMPNPLTRLANLLHPHRNLWQPQPFALLDLAWQQSHPHWAAWIEALPDPMLEGEPRAWLVGAPSDLQQLEQLIAQSTEPPLLPSWQPQPLPIHAMRRVPGRKVKQIEGFCNVTRDHLRHHRGEIVDWCAGKGHLGRALLQQNDLQLLAIDRDAALVLAGQAECDHLGLPARFVCADALDPATQLHLHADQWLTALHACGDLHVALLRAAADLQVRGVALAPCCYNLTRAEPIAPLSALGRALDPQLRPSDLDLIHREPLVAGSADRQQSLQEQAWRLGFDLLQRAVLGAEAYRPMPPFPRAWLRASFGEFCAMFAALDRVPLPPSLPWGEFERGGWQRLAQVRRRELIRGLFRPVLESWQVEDRGQFLRDHGFVVAIGAFCPREVTPRNRMILAQLQS